MDDIGERNRQRFDAPDAVAAYRAMVELSPAELQLFAAHVPPGARVLDLGVGTGRTTPWLQQRAARYLGIDVAPAMVAAARELHPAADIRVGDAASLVDVGDAQFDVAVFSYNGIDYLSDTDRGRALDEVRRVLAPGGAFLFSSHNPRGLIAALPTHGSWARRWAVATVATASRLRRLGPSRALRSGSGWVLDPAKGGLLTHLATPGQVAEELDAHGFDLAERLPGDLPRRPSTWRTPWWYYAATRR